MKPPCSVEGCPNEHAAKGLCRTHYARLRKFGRLHPVQTRFGGCPNGDACETGLEDDWCDAFRDFALGVIAGRAVLQTPPVDRLAVSVPDPCWVGVGWADQSHGYRVIRIGKKNRSVHRAALAAAGHRLGEFHVDHLCRNRECCNPGHLELVTIRENNRRSAAYSGVNARKTHCKYGHPLAPPNLRRSARPGRICLACSKAHSHARWLRTKGEAATIETVLAAWERAS